MHLLQSPTSPFARKIRVLLRENGVLDQVEEVDLSQSGLAPTRPVAELTAANPLGKIPTLVLQDGEGLFDSRVIAEYLDQLASPERRVLASSGPARWAALRTQALADGIADAAVLVRYERALRPGELYWPEWVEGQFTKIRQAVDAAEVAGPPAMPDLGAIALAVSLAYLDFRLGEEDLWRSRCPKLVAWHALFSARPSMAKTRPA